MTDADNGFVILELTESSALITGFELVLIVGGVATIVILGWWLRKSRQ
jgi:hypothetical protein